MIKHSQPRSKKVYREKSAEPILQYPAAYDAGEGGDNRRCDFQMETRHGFKYRQLHIEDYLREIPAEQGRVTGVYAHVSKLIEVMSRTVKDGRVIPLIHKYLRAGVMEDGAFQPTEEGVPQGGPLSPLCGNIMLNGLDRELERRGHKFVRQVGSKDGKSCQG